MWPWLDSVGIGKHMHYENREKEFFSWQGLNREGSEEWRPTWGTGGKLAKARVVWKKYMEITAL